jgi:hypothetical protein
MDEFPGQQTDSVNENVPDASSDTHTKPEEQSVVFVQEDNTVAAFGHLGQHTAKASAG